MQQISFLRKNISLEEIEDLLFSLGACSVTLTDNQDDAILEPLPGTMPLWPHTRITALFESEVDMDIVKFALEQALNTSLQGFERTIIEEIDWQNKIKEQFKAMHFGKNKNLCIYPSWDKIENKESIAMVKLDPGLAFGTGSHETTALCLDWLADNPPVKQLLIDYGCGSGILSLAALKLGARHIWAVDHEPQALEAVEQNMLENDIIFSHLYPALPEDLPPVQADTVLANILANTLIELSDILENLIKPQGTILLTGILKEQEALVKAAYPKLIFKDSIYKADWVLLIGKKI